MSVHDKQLNLTEQNDALQKIIGARLTSVQFVLDYLILGFDTQGTFTSLVWPEVIRGKEIFIFGHEEYRNELCSLIEKNVKSVIIDLSEVITIDFGGGAQVRIPIKLKTSGEAAILTSSENFLFVF